MVLGDMENMMKDLTLFNVNLCNLYIVTKDIPNCNVRSYVQTHISLLRGCLLEFIEQTHVAWGFRIIGTDVVVWLDHDYMKWDPYSPYYAAPKNIKRVFVTDIQAKCL